MFHLHFIVAFRNYRIELELDEAYVYKTAGYPLLAELCAQTVLSGMNILSQWL